MANESPGPTRRTWLDYSVLTTADRLVIRPPLACLGVAGLFLLLSVLLPWIMVELGLLDRAILAQISAMLAAGILFFMVLLCRWWTLDRTTNAVRYFPWRLCALTAIQGVRIVERRVGKRLLEITYTVDLDLEGGAQVRFAGFAYWRLGTPQARALATIIGQWLNVPVKEEHLSPAAPLRSDRPATVDRPAISDRPATLELYRECLQQISSRLTDDERRQLLRELVAALEKAEPTAAPDPAA